MLPPHLQKYSGLIDLIVDVLVREIENEANSDVMAVSNVTSIPRHVIHADVAAPPPGKVARRDAFLADTYEIVVDASQQNAAVTHTRGTAAGRTLRVSANGRDYQAVRIFVAASADGQVLGHLVAGAVVGTGGAIVTQLRQIAPEF